MSGEDGFAAEFARLTAVEPLAAGLPRPVTVAVLGAGARGCEYPRYGELFPGTMRVTAVADVLPARLCRLADRWRVPADRRFGDYRELLAAGRLADALIVALPDGLHFDAAMRAMELGYDLLLEKPMARTADECRGLLAQARRTGSLVAVGHVLRHSPYFRALKRVVDGGGVGELASIQHQEPVFYAHMAHSFVRGNWRNSRESTPMILAKSCHDLDILRYLAGRPCERIRAEGGLAHFRAEAAPPGAPARCTGGCPHESRCPYSAIDIYARKRWFLYALDLDRDCPEAEILAKLRSSPYGRCVYRCDNDQCDHYAVAMRFAGGVTATFSLDAFTPWGGRRTRIMGSQGYVEGDGESFSLWRFAGPAGGAGSGLAAKLPAPLAWRMPPAGPDAGRDDGHAGGDLALMRDFLRACAAGDPRLLSSSIDASVESHLMAFACEESRLAAAGGLDGCTQTPKERKTSPCPTP